MSQPLPSNRRRGAQSDDPMTSSRRRMATAVDGPENVRADLASLLAQAALRLRARAALGADRGRVESQIAVQRTPSRLDLPAESSLTGDHVVNAPDGREIGGAR
jgi:hypothetical protein